MSGTGASGSTGKDATGKEGKKRDPPPSSEVRLFLEETGPGKRIVDHTKGSRIFVQGDRCDAIFYLKQGLLQLTVLSESGREATIALFRPGAFVGEECASTAQTYRSATATALTDCVLLRIDKPEMMRVLKQDPAVAAYFVTYLLGRSSRIQADLVDQHFNAMEKRLARTLLLLAPLDEGDASDALVPKLSQETLAAMIGATRSRVNLFLNRFRRQGFLEYDGQIRIINRTLLQGVLDDDPIP